MSDGNEALIRALFLQRVAEDRQEGLVRSMEDYQRLFAGNEDLVAGQWNEVESAALTTPSPIDADDSSTQRLIGPYHIERELGRGGQGSVYLAQDERLRRLVAVKLLHYGALSPEGLERFRREAEAASRLEHPGICDVYDVGTEAGIPYIVMRYVQGESLADWIEATGRGAQAADFELTLSTQVSMALGPADESAAGSSPPPAQVREVLRTVVGVARALHAAHEAGIIHRDIKPGNIMVGQHGQPVIMDFGLALIEESEGPTLTRTGDVFGTPAYMSPEQLSTSTRLDRRTDVFSLGVTLYECLTGRKPFQAPTREALYRAILAAEPLSARKVNPAVTKDMAVVVETALAKDRDQRYQTAQDLADDIEAIIQHRPISARPISAVRRFARWARREPARFALLATLLMVMLAVGFAVAKWPGLRRDQEEAEAARTEKLVEEALVTGYAAYGEHRWSDAVRELNRALEAAPDSAEAAAGIAHSQLRLGEPVKALELLDRFRSHDEVAFDTMRVDVLRVLERAKQADSLEASLKGKTARSGVGYFALCNRELGPYAKRETFFVNPEDEQGSRSRKALDLINSAVAFPGNKKLIYYTARAIAAMRCDDREVMRQTAEILERFWPDSFRAWLVAGTTWARIDIDRSLRASREALRLDPKSANAHGNVGTGLRVKRKLDEASLYFRKAIELGGQPSHYNNLGETLYETGRLDDALAVFQDAADRFPRDAPSHMNLGVAHRFKGDVGRAIECLERATELDPQLGPAFMNLGRFLREAGRLDAAIEAHRRLIALRPENPRGFFELALDYEEGGRVAEAIRQYQKATGLKPEYAPASNNLGMLHKKGGRLDEAKACFENALRIRPDYKLAQANIESLRSEQR